jgi:hypothetical protein
VQKNGQLLQLATDGWKSKFAERGAALVNVLILKPNGGRMFHSIVNTTGESKNASYIAELHTTLAKEVTNNQVS